MALTLLSIVLLGFMLQVFSLRSRVASPRFLRPSSLLARHLSTPNGDDIVRVRFAPSPTGSLHLGGARTAMYNWLVAKQSGGKFIIRIEDTDEARSTRASEEEMLRDMKWLGLTWDEGPDIGGPYGPYRQSERKELYQSYAQRLVQEGWAYPCFCTEEELEAKRKECELQGIPSVYDKTWRDADPNEVKRRLEAGEPHAIRFRIPPRKIVTTEDIVRGKMIWDADACLGDFIILRSSGMPVYNFCVAVDDATMKITHVIRAEEHLSNTLRQMLILEALNFKPPTYAHCSLILAADRSKLSKRHGATSVTQFREKGFTPSAMMNYLASLGWNEGGTKEIYSSQELVDAFRLQRVIKAPAVFDPEKLLWMNTQHLRGLSAHDFEQLLSEYWHSHGVLAASIAPNLEEKFIGVCRRIYQPLIHVFPDATANLTLALSYNLEQTVASDANAAEMIASHEFSVIANKVVKDISDNAFPAFGLDMDIGVWKKYVKDMGAALGLKGKKLMHPLRLALTGSMSGNDIGDMLQLLAAAPGCVDSKISLVSLEDRVRILKKVMQI